ncbi:hypothetical protein MCETALH18_00104 [Methylophilaceae bacterium]
MKFNAINTWIAIGISSLITYGFNIIDSSTIRTLITAGSFIFLNTTLVIMIGITFKHPRKNVNIKVLASVFFVLALASNLIFSFSAFSTANYVITNGIMYLLFAFITHTIYKTKQ